jgi:hypothetical protein
MSWHAITVSVHAHKSRSVLSCYHTCSIHWHIQLCYLNKAYWVLSGADFDQLPLIDEEEDSSNSAFVNGANNSTKHLVHAVHLYYLPDFFLILPHYL